MTTWSSGWQNATLRQAKIPETQFAKDVLSLWSKSTPLHAWTNNPLGMPMRGHSPKAVPSTTYALFADMLSFRRAFGDFLTSKRGTGITAVLINADSLPDAWREIHALKWPANDTETEYPAALLDRLTADAAVKLAPKRRERRKSAGTVGHDSTLHQRIITGHQVLRESMDHNLSAADAIRKILKETP